MPINLIGLGLGSLEDVTVSGLRLIRESDEVYLEHYTSILSGTGISEFEEFYQKSVILHKESVACNCKSYRQDTAGIQRAN